VMQNLGPSLPWAINDRGLIVGQSANIALQEVRAAYYENGTWHSMGVLGGPNEDPIYTSSTAWDVNNRGQAVGNSTTDEGRHHAFIYANGVMLDLNSVLGENSGVTLTDALGINDRGQITGQASVPGVGFVAYLLTPTLDTFELDVTYANPLVLEGGAGDLPAEIAVKFVLEGIAGMSGSFGQSDILSAMVELEPGVWTTVDPTDFLMTLGPGGVTDILSLSYQLDTFQSPTGWELSLRNNSFQMYADGINPSTGESFAYHYTDSLASLALVPEPSSLALLGIAAAVCVLTRMRSKSAHRRRGAG